MHDPRPGLAWNERFTDLIRRVAGLLDGDGRPTTGGVPVDGRFGRGVDADPHQFDLTAFSLRLTNGANAVSQLHAATANATWQGLIERPILGITNGVHAPTWVGTAMADLYDRHLDADLEDLDPQSERGRFWERLSRIPDADIWRAHQRQKLELAIFARGRLRNQFARHGEAPAVLEELRRGAQP